MQTIKTNIAKANKVLSSLITSIPGMVRWLMMAPVITPAPIRALFHTVRGIRRRIAAIGSAVPEAYLPIDRIPNGFKDIYTLWSTAKSEEQGLDRDSSSRNAQNPVQNVYF